MEPKFWLFIETLQKQPVIRLLHYLKDMDMEVFKRKREYNKEVLTILGHDFVLCDDLDKKYFKYTQQDIKRGIQKQYFWKMHRVLNIKNPRLFTEKIQWLKLYDCTPIKTILADKLLVREWVKEKIGSKYLKKIYGTYNSFDEIDFSSLPKEYVIKANHGCNMQLLVIEGGKPDMIKDARRFDRFLHTNHAYKSRFELHYKDIKPKLFTEEYLKNTNELFEYLFFCFNGEPEFVLFASGKRSDRIECTMFDKNWKNCHFNYGEKLHREEIPKPENFDEMLSIARKLSADFKFVHVDLHNINGRIYFGEMTFTPAGGFMKFNPRKYDRILGDMLNLN